MSARGVPGFRKKNSQAMATICKLQSMGIHFLKEAWN
jgi:hypothetical protein